MANSTTVTVTAKGRVTTHGNQTIVTLLKGDDLNKELGAGAQGHVQFNVPDVNLHGNFSLGQEVEITMDFLPPESAEQEKPPAKRKPATPAANDNEKK